MEDLTRCQWSGGLVGLSRYAAGKGRLVVLRIEGFIHDALAGEEYGNCPEGTVCGLSATSVDGALPSLARSSNLWSAMVDGDTPSLLARGLEDDEEPARSSVRGEPLARYMKSTTAPSCQESPQKGESAQKRDSGHKTCPGTISWRGGPDLEVQMSDSIFTVVCRVLEISAGVLAAR